MLYQSWCLDDFVLCLEEHPYRYPTFLQVLMLMITSWWLVLLQASSALGGSGQPGFCEGVPGTASSQSSSGRGPGKRGSPRSKLSTCSQGWSGQCTTCDLRSPRMFFSHSHHCHLPARQVFSGCAECDNSQGGAHWQHF